MNYSKALKIVRSIYNLEQRDLAHLAEVDPSYISTIESGKKKPSIRLIDTLSKKLSIPKKLFLLLASENNLNINSAMKARLGELLLKANKDAIDWK